METAEEWSGVRGQHGQQLPFDPTQIAAVSTFVFLHSVDLPPPLEVQRPDMRLAALWLLTTVYISTYASLTFGAQVTAGQQQSRMILLQNSGNAAKK